jgi:membrane protein implicated in regulation of membrane protease activity
MVMISELAGIVVVLLGAVLFSIELLHPGALLIIPGTIMLVGGMLYLLIPSVLLDSVWGPIAVALAAIIATAGTIWWYRWLAGTHLPLSTTSGGLVGEEAVVIAEVVPNTLKGKIRVRSEVWSARGATAIPVGTRVRVVRGEGVSVTVEPLDPRPPA